MRLPRVRHWWAVFPALLILTPVGVVLINAWVDRVARPWVFGDLGALPHNRVGLVLGTAPTLGDGRRNLFFVYRMQAAAQLYQAGRVEYLLVSGDNSTKTYDEPSAMRDALVALGVPRDRIYLDYAGFRTLDSVVRAEAVFEERSFTVVSQRFHNERAVFIARERGLEAVGFNARDVSTAVAPQVRIREYFARVQMMLDLFLLNTRPKFYGEPIRIGIDPIQ